MEVKRTREINLKEQDWALRMILQSYRSHMEELTMAKEEYEDYIAFDAAEDHCLETHEQMIKLLLTAEALRCGEIFTIEDFIRDQESGCFTDYDGFGYYLDWYGNKLGDINWYDFNECPLGTRFVA